MLLLRQVRQQCVGALRASSSKMRKQQRSSEKVVRNEPKPATRAQVEAACVPEVFKSTDALVQHLEQSMIHVPGRFVILQKPFGVSCLNTKTNYSWERSRSQRSPGKENAAEERYESLERPVILVDCIPQLSKLLHEPQLGFWTGLKRCVSGPVILPCSTQDYDMMWDSQREVYRLAQEENKTYHSHSALALVVGRPKQREGTIEGHVAFKYLDNFKQYFFIEGSYSGRSGFRSEGKFSLQGGMAWSTIASGHECSLLHVQFSKFALSRIALRYLNCPLLGDSIATDRLIEVNGKPSYVNPLHEVDQENKYTPHQLIARLGPDAPPLNDLWMYFHVLQQKFPKYGGKTDLAISAPLSPHFEAMIDLLGYGEALKKFRNKKELQVQKDHQASIIKQLQDEPPLPASPLIDKAARNEPKPVASSQFKDAYMPEVFKSTDSLVRHLEQSMILHEPGRFVILQKPYGVICHNLKPNYFRDKFSSSGNESAAEQQYESLERRLPIIVDCIPHLSKLLREPQLGYWGALTRYQTGPLILPCSKEDSDALYCSKDVAATRIERGEEFYKLSALTLVVGRPENDEGSVKGNIISDQTVGRNQHFFAESSSPMRNRMTGKYTMHDRVAWNTIASGHDCSLVHVQFSRLSSPRYVLSHLNCPILGDSAEMRLIEVDGRLINLKPSQAAEHQGEKYIPHQLIARLGPDAPPPSYLPVYFHVLHQKFPNYDGSSDLVASAPVPPHFEAMVDLLGFGEALKKFRNENTPISPSLILQGLDHESPQDSDDIRYY